MIFRLLQRLTKVSDNDIRKMSDVEVAFLCLYWGALGAALIVIFFAVLVGIGIHAFS